MKSLSRFPVLSKGLGGFFAKFSRQRNQSSHQKQTNEEHLRLLFDNSPTGIAVVHARTGKRIYANPRLLELFAVASLEELNAFDMAKTYVNETDWENVRNYIRSGTALRRDIFERKRVNGERWWALLDAVPLEFMGEPAIVVWHTDVTDQKKAENKLETALGELKESRNELQASEERLRQLFDSSPAGIVALRIGSGERLYANPRLLEMFNVQTLDELNKFGLSDTYVNQKDWETARDYIQTGAAFRRFILERKRVTGEHWWALLDAVPMNFMGERSIVVWHTDITEQKLSETALETTLAELKESRNALEESEHRLSQILASSPVGVSVRSIATGKQLYANRRFFEMSGVENPDEMEKFGIENSYVSKTDWHRVKDAMDNGLAFNRYVMERKKATGERWWSLIDGVPVMFKGEPSMILWHHDITEQKKSDAALSDLLESSPIGVSIIGANIDERSYINSSYLKLFGADSLEQLEAFGFLESFVSRSDFEKAQRHFTTRIGSESSIMQRRKINGEEWWAKIYAVPIEYKGSEAFIIWCTDITDQKQAEAELVQSERLASLGGMVAGVAHEINTPIGVGVTAASYLQERTEELKGLFEQGLMKKSSFEEFLETATQSSAIISSNLMRAANLIRSFKQVAVDQSAENMRTFNLLEYIREVMQSLDPQLKKKPNITILIDGDEDLELENYPGSIAQILTNLVLNSVIHGFPENQQGQISIHAQTDGTYAHLVYRDTGKGIEPENLPRIFDPFFTTNRGAGGSGLGLNIVYNLVTQKLGGTVKCESAPDAGVTMTILIPIRLGIAA